MNFICRLVSSLVRVFVARWNCVDFSEESLVYIMRGLIKRAAGFSEISNSLHGIASDKTIVLIIIALTTTNLEFVSYRCCVTPPPNMKDRRFSFRILCLILTSLTQTQKPHILFRHEARFFQDLAAGRCQQSSYCQLSCFCH